MSGSRLYTGLEALAPATAEALLRALPVPLRARESKNSSARALMSAAGRGGRVIVGEGEQEYSGLRQRALFQKEDVMQVQHGVRKQRQ
jgi:hypothetical protein